MKLSTRILLVAGLLLVAGWSVLWLSGPHNSTPHNGGRPAVAATTPSTPGPGAVAGPSAPKFSVLNTNKLAFRLSNTTNSIRKLESMPHAILLANAFIDTDQPLDLKIPNHLRSSGNSGAYIVQARSVIDGRFRAALAAAGAGIVSYIPNNSYLVNLTAQGAAALAGSPVVQAVLPYEPYYKIQSSLLGLAVNQQPLPPGTMLKLGVYAADEAAAGAQLEKLGAKIVGQDQSPFGPVLRVLAPKDWIALAQSPVVQFLQPSFARRRANDLSRVTDGISPDTLTSTNYLNLYGSNVLVAINDSGIDRTHPDLTPRVSGITPLDLVDTDGHGTHVAGIIASSGLHSDNPTDVGLMAQGSTNNADFRGKAPLARLFSASLNSYSDYQLQTNAATVGALISNNSWDYGNGDAEYDLAAASYDAATRDALPFATGSQPVLFVFAAGNNGGGDDNGQEGFGDSILSPATAKNVITVGALEQLRNITNLVTDASSNTTAFWQPKTDSSDQVAEYSSRGNVGIGTEGDSGRFKPDLVAPGTFVVSTRSGQWNTNAYYDATNNVGVDVPDQLVTTNFLDYLSSVSVPDGTIGIVISIVPNQYTITFPTNMLIYCQQSGPPDPINAPGSIDIITSNNTVIIPPGAGNCTLANLMGNGFSLAVGDPTNVPVNFDVLVSIWVTNALGNQEMVLEQLNETLAPYYRYESGTSMAAADVSGVLALIQDYFTNQFKPALTPSPALMKALLINGSRSIPGYQLALTNTINFEGWGWNNITDSVPVGGLNNQFNQPLSSFFVEQNPTNALATGDRHTFLVNLSTSNNPSGLPLTATLVWTDPPGDPAAAIKLVNNLDIIITNLATGDVYFGNDISSAVGHNLPWNTNNPPNLDTINNVKQILLASPLATNYSVTVLARSVNVNAVTAQTNNFLSQYAPNIVQDFALVISVGEGQVTNAFTVTDGHLVTNPTGDQDITVVTTTNTPLLNQFVGASSPLLGTNSLPLGTNTVWGPNGLVTIGQTNQWHFYIVTNTGAFDYTNAVFLTFNVSTLAIPRMGVFGGSVANATKPEADIDLFVTDDPTIVDLNPVAVSNCLAGVGNARASVANAGTQFVYYTNSLPGRSVYYIGVQSEDQMGSEYDFLPIFTDTPFGGLDQNGNQIVNGLLLPQATAQGDNKHPGLTNIFALAVIPMEIEKVIVTNLDEHGDLGDLVGALKFGGQAVILNNHDGAFGDTFGKAPIVYDDSRDPVRGTTNSDGPGSLANFRTKQALGPWILSVLDDSAGGYTGQVSRLTLLIQPHRSLKQPGIIVSVPPGGWFIDYVDVPAGYTNLTFYGTNVTFPPVAPPTPIQMYEKFNVEPTLTDYDQEATLTNGIPPGNLISVGPPLAQGQYFVGLYNPNTTLSQSVYLSATLGVNANANDIYNYDSGAAQKLLDDAVTGSSITVPNTVTQLVASLNVGLVINSPRISDYAFTLVSPTGQRVLLMEDRGGGDTNGAGEYFVYTNVLNTTATGGAAADTNYLAVDPLGSTVPITWNFYTVPDQMTVYATTNPADFNPNNYYPGGFLLYNTGLTNNPPGPGGGGGTNTLPVTYNLNVPPGISQITIIMNQFGNPGGAGGDAWIYTAGAPVTNYEYLMFTDDTNLASVPIKFAAPPFDFTRSSTNFTLSDFDLMTNRDYLAPTNIPDAFGGWNVPTNLVTVTTLETNLGNTNLFVQVTNVLFLTNNLVSVVTDPSSSLAANAGITNFLALGDGTITRSIPTVPGRIYNVTFWYRGPGIAGWWRGEGNGNDSSDPENLHNNGNLIGRFNFPAGEVGQAFGFEDQGNPYQFAGTNTYVQVPASPSLDVGDGGGLTVEGWINPTNLAWPQPLVEWLARVPTNSAADTNLAVVQGPVLDSANGHYYYLLSATNWLVSESWAEALGGHLATVQTANEENWIYDTFTAYGTTNRYLWIGLTNNGAKYSWTDSTNIAYTNWLATQPNNCAGANAYTLILSPTNAFPGLWSLADKNGFLCGSGVSNQVFGVVEAASIPTNGVQFWISGTNWTPGLTNALQGCLFANIVDTNYVSHRIWSAPGLLTTNVYQHVALTFNTNSGIAALYLNGTNVATTNLFTASGSFVPFQPKADGDVLLGYDLSLYTNNFYGGEMDEMSIYGRALSDAEISAIYRVSADSTNRLIGKFDPTVTPATGLAEALVTFGASSNVIYGVNDQWQVNSFTFNATSNSMPLTISGLEPGILLDSFAVAEAPETNLFYFPEQPLAALNGTPAAGPWTLQVWDSRAGAYVTNVDQLVNWQLSFVLVSNAIVSAALAPETPLTTTIPPGQTIFYSVTVPPWANEATNIVVSSTEPVTMFYFSPTNPPGGVAPPDATLLTPPATSGVGNPILITNTPTIPLGQGQTYYLGVQNNGPHAAEAVLEVDYDILTLTNGTPFTDVLANEYIAERYFAFDVTSNAYEATFQLLKLNGNADLVLSQGPPLPTLSSDEYGSFNNGTLDQNIYLVTNSTPVPLSFGRWYLGVINRGAGPVQYSVLAKELDLTNGPPVVPNVFTLTNNVPFTWTAGPGAALTNFFSFSPTNSVASGTNVNLFGLRFELFNLSGNVDLTLQTNALPLAPPFFQTSQNPGTSPELIFVYTNNVLTNLAANWLLGVPNHEITNVTYTIIAQVLTNSYFPAFPTAQGAGGGAHGGRGGTVYHVINTSDSGPGSLRDAVNTAGTNLTVVFDIGGIISLASPLVITNSYLTIAGETSPGGGITVAGQMTTVQSAHDVIIRDVRFRSLPGATATVWANGFEQAASTGLTAGQYFAGGWLVAAGSVDVLATGFLGSSAAEGDKYLDLDGTSAGTISTNITTVPGQVYTLHFDYTRNPNSLISAPGQPAATPQASVLINGQPLATVVGNMNNSWANLGWQPVSYVFTAPSASTLLTFQSLDAPTDGSGVLLDAVSLTTNTLIYDGFEGALQSTFTPGQTVKGWQVLNNQVNLVNDPANAAVGHTNFLALANGVISNTLPTIAGQTYSLSVAYRGPGIAGWWRGEGTPNSSVFGNNPTNNPTTVTYAAGKVDNALSFDGANSYVTMPPSPTLAVTNLTIEGWIYPTTTDYEPLVEYGGGGQFAQVSLWINGFALDATSPGTLYAGLRPANQFPNSAPGVVPQNAWSHVALTVDLNLGQMWLYCNGASVGGATFSTPVAPPATPVAPLNLGYRDINSMDVFQGFKFAGLMDEMSVYSRALSPSEIKAIYANGASGKFDPAIFASAPDQSLAEAVFSIPGVTNATLVGNNTNWQQLSFTFTAPGNGTPVVLQGLEPGLLLDSVSAQTHGNPGGSLQFNAVSNAIADHVSISWSTNADLAVFAATNLTVQWSILSDSLYSSNQAPGIGSLLREGSGALSLHHNLYADNDTGSPRLGDNLTLDFVNNVVYNWGQFAGLSGGINDLADFSASGATNQLNYVGNYLIAGTDTANDSAGNYAVTNIAFFGGVTNALTANWIFQTNNFIDSDNNGILNGANTGWAMFTNDYRPFARAFPTPPVAVDEAYQAYEKVLDFAGVDLALRDPADTNIVNNVRTQTGRIISTAPILPGLNTLLPYLDTDQDGIPDFWEDTFTPKLVFVPSNNNDRDGDGYTDLEEFDNWLAAPHALTVTNTPVGVDLYQLCGGSGHLAFFVTNSIHGSVYLTNVLGSVTNTSPSWSNSIAVFTPTNTPSSGTNYYGYASFDVYVTNLDTSGYFGPVTVSVIVSAVPIAINYNFPPAVTILTSGVSSDPTNSGGSDFYGIYVSPTNYGALFELDNPTGPMAIVITNGLPYASLSSFAYYTNTLSPIPKLQIAVLTNSLPVPLSPGYWYMSAVNESGSNVVYTAKITLLGGILAPVFLFPTNTTSTNIVETVPWSYSCVATDLDIPPLPLSFAIVNGPSGLTVNNGLIQWTPTEAQGPSTNTVAVSVSNGAFSITNTFTIVVEESNLPPVLPVISNQVVFLPATLVVTNTATDPDIPINPLTYTLLTAPLGSSIDTNSGIITWTPTLAQAGSSYLFTTVVTDTNPWAVNAKSLSATNQFYVTVVAQSFPGQPLTNVVGPNSIQWYGFTVPPNAIAATNTLVFASGPVNFWFSPNLPPSVTNATDAEFLTHATSGSRVITTNSVPLLVPGSVYFLGVQNANAFAVTNVVRVDFDLVFPPPFQVLGFGVAATNITGTNGYLVSWLARPGYQFHLLWSPTLVPAVWTAFNGVISEISPSGTNGLFQYFDNGTQTGAFGSKRFYRLLLLNSPTNTPPFFLSAPGVFLTPPSVPFQLTNAAADWDVPPQTLNYSVTDTLAATNLTINPLTGVIAWTPSSALAGQTNVITTTVTDGGVPPQSITNTFSVIVTTNLAPSFSSVIVTGHSVQFQWTAITNDQFQVRWATNLPPTWHLFTNLITSTTGTFSFTDTNTALLMKFYQLILVP